MVWFLSSFLLNTKLPILNLTTLALLLSNLSLSYLELLAIFFLSPVVLHRRRLFLFLQRYQVATSRTILLYYRLVVLMGSSLSRGWWCNSKPTVFPSQFAGECQSVQTCVQCPVKFSKQHVTPICRKRIQQT